METNSLQTRGQLADAVAAFMQDTSAARRTMILQSMDQGFRDALQRYDWPGLVRWVDAAVVVAAGEAYFHAPEDARMLLGVVDSTTPLNLESWDLGGLVAATDGYADIRGRAVAYAFVGSVGINTLITVNTALEVVSDGVDTRTFWLGGRRGNNQTHISFALTGTSAVSLGLWDDVTQVNMAAVDANRTVTVRGQGAGVTYSQIRPSNIGVGFLRYRIAAVPGQSTTLRLIYKYTPPTSFDDGHVYPLPINNFLFDFAIGRMYQSRRQWDGAREHIVMAENSLLNAMQEAESGRTRLPKVSNLWQVGRRRWSDS